MSKGRLPVSLKELHQRAFSDTLYAEKEDIGTIEKIIKEREIYSGNIQAYSNIVVYRAYDIPEKDLEARDCTNIIWKKDTGLIGYQHSRTPAGADLILAWDPAIVAVDDMRLDVK